MISRRSLLASMLALPALAGDRLSGQDAGDWVPLFDGSSLSGWRAGEHAATWSVKDGCLVADGPASHLYYQGGVRGADFRNFELQAEVQSMPGSSGGLFFHAGFQQAGVPARGLKVQIDNTPPGGGASRDVAKTGSLHGVRHVCKVLAKDGTWFSLHVAVRGRNVLVSLDGTLLVDYVQPDAAAAGRSATRALGHGTFALQAPGSSSLLRFRDIRVRPLPDGAFVTAAQPPAMDQVSRRLARLTAENYPVVDYHVHLKGLTLEEALQESRRTGIFYGLAVNCGIGFPVNDDRGALDFLRSIAGQPVFVAMQGEGREWVKTFSPGTIAQFDYVFTDAMTFTDDRGQRIRLWIPPEVADIGDHERFMDVIVDRILGVLNDEPIDIYVNPTFVPQQMQPEYDALWTPQRMAKVIDAAKKHDVAIEINARYKIPGAAFIRQAKQAGVRFSFGTNNSDRNLGRLEYCLDMVDQCGLGWQDIFVPPPDGRKAIQRRRLG